MAAAISASRQLRIFIRHTQVIYPLVQEAMRSGLYTPNRKSMFCSRSGCPFWKACEAEYGGEVEE